MIIVRKPWPWSLQRGATTLWPFIFYSGLYPSWETIEHEKLHGRQQRWWLIALVFSPIFLSYFALYLFALPIVFNPLRYRWEWECYYKANRLDPETIKKILARPFYGWLSYSLNGWAVPKEWKKW